MSKNSFLHVHLLELLVYTYTKKKPRQIFRNFELQKPKDTKNSTKFSPISEKTVVFRQRNTPPTQNSKNCRPKNCINRKLAPKPVTHQTRH